MKAAQISEYGHADKIIINDVPKPNPADGQVLVEVYAASINPFDTAVREGYMQQMVPLQLPVTLGGDIAGVVTAVGAGVTSVAVGDKVYGQAQAVSGASGALAEYATTAVDQVGKMPAKLGFNEAAALPLTGLSAMQVIQDKIKLAAGQKILIHGGAGGIGTIAIQLAKHLGAYVATTATGEGIAYARSLGADEVIDYQTQAFDELLHDYDAVFDTIGKDTYTRSFSVLKPGGVIVSMLEQPNTALAEQHKVTAIAQGTTTTMAALDALACLSDEGVVTVHVDKVYPLAQTVAAFEARDSGLVRGKVVVEIKS